MLFTVGEEGGHPRRDWRCCGSYMSVIAAVVVCARFCVIYSTRVVVARESSASKTSARMLYFCGGQTTTMVPVTRFVPLSDLPVLLGEDPDVRSVLFEDVFLHVPFLPSLILRRKQLVRSLRVCLL